ncbi:MAG TPA: flippase-like domain-containing protein [Bacilli bacterium]|nr:flippase-like domain-containing protein [Bacilli bacterium]
MTEKSGIPAGNENKEKMQSKRKTLISVAMLLLSLFLIAFVIYRTLKKDMPESFADFFSALPSFFPQWPWLVGAFLCLVIYVIANAVKFSVLTHSKNGRWYFKASLNAHIVGRYYDLISPYSTAGEPYQVYRLQKCHLSVGQATSVAVVNFFTSRVAFFILAIWAFLMVPQLEINLFLRIVAYLGVFSSTIFPCTVMTLSFFPRVTNVIMRLVFRIIDWLHLKKATEIKSKLIQTIRNYQMAIAEFKDNKLLLLLMLLISLVGQFAYNIIPFFVIKAVPSSILDTANLNIITVFAMCMYAVNFANVMPTPGGSGGAEYSFASIFATFISGTYLTWAMFIWRFLVFYIYIFAGFLITVVTSRIFHRRRPYRPEPNLPIRTYQFIDNYYPIVDGVIKVVDNYALTLNRQGHPTSVVAPFYQAANDSIFSYPIIRLPSYKLSFSEYEVAKRIPDRQLLKLVKCQRPAVIHAHSPFIVGHLGLRIAIKKQIPIIATFHSKFYDDFYEATHSKAMSKIGIRYVVNFFNAVDEVWTVSFYAAGVLRGYGYHGPIRVIPNGTDFFKREITLEEKESIRQKYHIEKKNKNLLFVGHLIWQKNLKLVLDTFARLRRADIAYALTIVGEGGNEKEVKDYARRIGIYDDVNWLGAIKEREELQGIYSVTDLFFFPSMYETFSIVLREASVMGIPSLVSFGGGCAEPITDGVNGYLAVPTVSDMFNRIQGIFTNPQDMVGVGKKAQNTIPLGWDNIVQEVKVNYERIIEDYYEKLAKK